MAVCRKPDKVMHHLMVWEAGIFRRAGDAGVHVQIRIRVDVKDVKLAIAFAYIQSPIIPASDSAIRLNAYFLQSLQCRIVQGCGNPAFNFIIVHGTWVEFRIIGAQPVMDIAESRKIHFNHREHSYGAVPP